MVITMAEHALKFLHIISTSKYKALADFFGKPVAPSSNIYEDLSIDIKEETGKNFSPKYVYTILQGNRYQLWDKFLNFHNIEKRLNITLNTSEESILNISTNNGKIEFQLILSHETWSAIAYEDVTYSDKKMGERTYNVLFRKVWSDVLFIQLWEHTHILCALSFKRCKITDSGIFLKICYLFRMQMQFFRNCCK